ncbi:cell division protein FtsQ [Staphylococcus hominis]
MDDKRGNRNKKIRSIKRTFDEDKAELENDEKKKSENHVEQKDDIQKEKNLSNNRTSNKHLNSSKSKNRNLKEEIKTSLRNKRSKFQNNKYAHLTVAEKREQQKKDKRKRQKRIQYIIITALILLILIFLLYMFTPLSRISYINISGNHNVSNSQVEKELNVKDGTRIYTFSKSKAINNLKKNSLIKDVEIHKQLPNTLNVKIIENNLVGFVKDKNKYVPIIEGNKKLKNYNGDIASSAPMLEDFKGEDLNNITKALSKMSNETRNMISEIKYAPLQNQQNRVLLYMKDGMQVVGDINTIANKIKYYPQMSQSLEKDSSGNLKTQGYIDLSVGASFIPYNENSSVNSKSDQNVRQKTQEETEAKNELQSVLNKISEQSDTNN